ncbi:hypothetical protein MTO96_009415 [Rhipicephalus appendiculatus]
MILYLNLLQPPFYRVIPSIDYGAAGQIAGHEMMHAFDVDGKRRDDNNTEGEWWSRESNEEYNKRVVDICKLYGRQHSNRGFCVEDRKSEILADFAVLRAVYNAYHQVPGSSEQLKGLPEFSSDMLFFISYCMKWCSTLAPDPRYPEHEDRCNVPLQHMQEFSATFNCTEGEVMNPRKKIRFW